VITVSIGRLPGFQQLNVNITVLPLIPGLVTNQVQAKAATVLPQVWETTFEVTGDRVPELGIAESGPGTVLLNAWAQPGNAYVLERAVLQPVGQPLVWTPLTNFVFAAPVFQMQDIIQSTEAGARRPFSSVDVPSSFRMSKLQRAAQALSPAKFALKPNSVRHLFD
jgi:hypothetical protein